MVPSVDAGMEGEVLCIFLVGWLDCNGILGCSIVFSVLQGLTKKL